MCRLSTQWSACHVLLTLYVTSLSCNPVECLSCFTQTVCDQHLLQPCGVFVMFYSHFTQTIRKKPLLPPCGALAMFYSNCMWPASLAVFPCCMSASTTLWSTCHHLLKLSATSLFRHPVEHLSCFTQTVCDQLLLQYFLVVCQLYVSLHNTVEHLSCFTQSVHNQPLLPPCGALVMFYSKCMRPASLATLWSTCHVLLKVYATSLSCNLVKHLSCFTQSVCDQPLLPPCGALVMFYSKCMRPASLATLSHLWSTCHVLLKEYATSLSCHLVEHLSCFTQSVHSQPLLPPCGAVVMFYSKCAQPASLATLWSSCHVLLKVYATSLSCHLVEHLSCFTHTVCGQPLLQCFLVVCQPPQHCGALVTFYSNCTQPASLATLWSTCHVLLKLSVPSLSCSISLLYVSLHNMWSTCHVLLKVCTTSLSCNLVEHLSCFTQSVHNQPLLQPCGALVMFYSKCMRPASLATLWSTCQVLLKLCATSLSRHPVELLSHFTQNVHNQPLSPPCGALVTFYSHCTCPASLAVFPCCEYVSPFVLSEGRQLAFMVTPDMMGKDEIAAFPLVAEYQPYMYLAIRNLILALWSQNIKVGRQGHLGKVGWGWGAGGVEVGSVGGGGVRRGVGGREGQEEGGWEERLLRWWML